MAKQKKVKTNMEIFMGMRKSWGNVNPRDPCDSRQAVQETEI